MTIDLGLVLVVCLALVFSVLLNFLLIWFLRGLTTRLVLVSENMSDLVDHLAKYGSNLKSIHDMELYYGDETIKGLVRHTQMVLEVLSDFEEIYALTDDEEAEEPGEEEEEEEKEENLDEDNREPPEKDSPTPQIQRKAIFHPGS